MGGMGQQTSSAQQHEQPQKPFGGCDSFCLDPALLLLCLSTGNLALTSAPIPDFGSDPWLRHLVSDSCSDPGSYSWLWTSALTTWPNHPHPSL